MALTFTVKRSRDGESFNGATGSKPDSIKLDWSLKFTVELSDPGNSSFNPASIGAARVYHASGLPKVNRSIYYDGAVIIPWLVCKSKSVKRRPGNSSLWDVDCKFSSGERDDNNEDDNEPQDPPNDLTDITPRVEQSFEDAEQYMRTDKKVPTPQLIQSPTGNPFAEPVMEPLTVLVLKVTQYETSITYDAMMARRKKTNSTTWNTKAANKWLIDEVEATEVEVQLASGPVLAALVTYTIKLSPFDWGWLVRRTLIDSHYLDADGKLQPFLDDTAGTQIDGYVNTDGTRKLPAGGATTIEPATQDFWRFQAIDFTAFMQVGNP